MAENFPNLGKETDTQAQEDRVPSEMNPERVTSRHIIIKMAKINTEILKRSKRISTSYVQGNF